MSVLLLMEVVAQAAPSPDGVTKTQVYVGLIVGVEVGPSAPRVRSPFVSAELSGAVSRVYPRSSPLSSGVEAGGFVRATVQVARPVSLAFGLRPGLVAVDSALDCAGYYAVVGLEPEVGLRIDANGALRLLGGAFVPIYAATGIEGTISAPLLTDTPESRVEIGLHGRVPVREGSCVAD